MQDIEALVFLVNVNSAKKVTLKALTSDSFRIKGGGAYDMLRL